MRKSLVSTIAAAALLASAGLATAQQAANMPGGKSKSAQGAYEGQYVVRGKYGSHTWFTGPTQGRSAAEKKTHRSSQPAPKGSSTQSPSGAGMQNRQR
jgi:ABC-type sugar transport system substrate-binding protein